MAKHIQNYLYFLMLAKGKVIFQTPFIMSLVCFRTYSVFHCCDNMVKHNGWMNGQINGWMDQWMDREMDGQMDGWINAFTDGWMDRWMNIRFLRPGS